MTSGRYGFKSRTHLMFHLCHEEVLAVLGLLPILRVLQNKIRAYFHARKLCAHDEKNETTVPPAIPE